MAACRRCVSVARASALFLIVLQAGAIAFLLTRYASTQRVVSRMQAELNDLHLRDLGFGHELPSAEALGGHVPIFVLHRDRHTMLRRLVASLRAVIDTRLTPFVVFVHDMQSSNPETLRALDELQKASAEAATPADLRVIVHRDQTVESALADAIARDPTLGFDARVNIVLNSVRQSIEQYLQTHRGVQYYVVTDPDVELPTGMPGDVLALAALLLERFPTATLVAPGLRTDDLPQSTCRSHLVRFHESGFWEGLPHSIGVGHVRRYFSVPMPVDTTFAMYRRSFPFSRLNWGVRLHHPYVIRHLPWYEPLARANWTAEARYYVDHALPITHWTGKEVAAQPEADAATLDRTFEAELRNKYAITCDRKLPPH